jgi:hypothetical protein
MPTERPVRRAALLKGKRHLAFDPAQRWFEGADRQRAMRALRVHLRAGRPVFLHTLRWSQPNRFLDDVVADLSIGTPRMDARVLSVAPASGKGALQAWSWLMSALTPLLGRSEERGFAQAVSREGYRARFRHLLVGEAAGPVRGLFLTGLEHLHFDVVRDLVDLVRSAAVESVAPPRVVVVLAGAVEPRLSDPWISMALPDYGAAEAAEAIVEIAGPRPCASLSEVHRAFGGVPAMVEKLAAEGPRGLSEVLEHRDAVWRRLGPLGVELRSAFTIVQSDTALGLRLEALAQGTLPTVPELDRRLARAGLVQIAHRRGHAETVLRMPLLLDLVDTA